MPANSARSYRRPGADGVKDSTGTYWGEYDFPEFTRIEDSKLVLTTRDKAFMQSVISNTSCGEDVSFSRFWSVGDLHFLEVIVDSVMDDWENSLIYEGYSIPDDMQALFAWSPPTLQQEHYLLVEIVPSLVTLAAVKEAVAALQIICTAAAELPLPAALQGCADHALGRRRTKMRDVILRCRGAPEAVGSLLARGLQVHEMFFRVRPTTPRAEWEDCPPLVPGSFLQPADVTTAEGDALTARPKRQLSSSPRTPDPIAQAEKKRRRTANASRPSEKPAATEEPPPPPTLQCYRCQGFGHRSSLPCTAAVTCRKCSGEHSTKLCQDATRRCANCQGAHAASSESCPARPRQPLQPRQPQPGADPASRQPRQQRQPRQTRAEPPPHQPQRKQPARKQPTSSSRTTAKAPVVLSDGSRGRLASETS